MSEEGRNSRRSFLRSLAAVPAITTVPLGENVFELCRADEPARPAGPNDRIRIATIGFGIIGHADTETALKVPGVELAAVADLYEGRRAHARELHGDHVAVTVDYREILERKDVDAVLLCVPDHWHARMSMDAMRAGKAVYCEKPMVRRVEEGPEVIAAQKATGAVFQVGSQMASSLLYDKVKELIKSGAIGPVNTIEARYNRNSPIGAWQYSIPTDASEETIDWDRFLGDAPKRPFDSVRFFRWRNYWDYGTAVAGDLLVHLLTGIHHALGSIGPSRVAAMGGQRYWKDGRDVYDVMLALLDYPQTDAHPSFTLALQSNFEDGGGENTFFRFVGSDGVISVGYNDLIVTRTGIQQPTEEQVLKGYNSVRTFSRAQQEAFAERYRAEHPSPPPRRSAGEPEKFAVPRGYNPSYDHLANFFKAVRKERPVYEDAVFGYRAAAPTLLCNESYRTSRIIGWDPVAMKVRS